MDQRPKLWGMRFDFECLVYKGHSVPQALRVVPVYPADNLTPSIRITRLLLQEQSDGPIDSIIDMSSSGAEGIRSQPKQLSIAPCHKAVGRGSNFVCRPGPRQEIGIVDDPFISALRAD